MEVAAEVAFSTKYTHLRSPFDMLIACFTGLASIAVA